MTTRLFRGLSTLLLLLLTGNSWSQIANPEVLYYSFDATGIKVPNHALTPPTGADSATVMGGLTTTGTGQCGNALVGSGTSSTTDYLNTGWATNLTSASPWTISVWTSNIASSATLFYIFGDLNAGSFRCFTNGVAGAGNWILRGTGLTDVYVNGGATVAASVTTFVYDPTTANIKAYLNGTLVSTVAQGAFTLSSTGPFKVMGYSANVGSPAGGLMDEFRLYNRALSPAEVMQLYTRETTSTISVMGCGQYVSPSGLYTWTTAGTYNDTIPNAYCGDSVMTINLTINQPTASTINPINCGDYTSPSGLYTWTTSGTYMDTIPNAVGCDSVMTVNLTILQPTAATVDATVCGSYDSPSGNYTWTVSGTYMDTIPNAIGCDSVMTFNLTILQPTSSTFSVSVCNSYDSPSGLYTWTASGTYNDTIPNAAGCDSVMTFNLTILQPTSSIISASSCAPYLAPDGAIYTTTGQYMAIVPNAAGCDSVITINFTSDIIDTSLVLSGTTLTANQTGVTYQWMDCGTGLAVSGETGQSFTPANGGTYSVTITSANCTATSDCWLVTYAGLDENKAPQLSVFPNPVTSTLTVANPDAKEFALELYNSTGQLISETISADLLIAVDMRNCAQGIYLLKAHNADSQQTFRIVRN